MDYDLGGLLNKGIEFTLPEIKCLCKQLFQGKGGFEDLSTSLLILVYWLGLHYLQVNNILHRDLKVANLLLNRHGVLKIADFGELTSLLISLPNLTPLFVFSLSLLLKAWPGELIRKEGIPVEYAHDGIAHRNYCWA